MRIERNLIRQREIKYFLIASLIGYSGGLTNYLINYDIKIFPLYPFGNLTILIYICLIGIGIVKHNFMDIRIIIRRTIFYSLLAALLSFFYVLAIFLTNKILVEPTLFESRNIFSRFNPFVLSNTLVVLSALFFGFFVYSKDTKRKLYQLWLYFNLAIVVWGVGGVSIGISQNPSISLWMFRFAYAFGVMWIPVFLFHIVCEYCEIDKKTFIKFLYLFHLAVIPFIFTGYFFSGTRMFFDSFYYVGSRAFFYPVMFLIWLAISGYGLVLLLRSFFLARQKRKKHFGYTFSALVIACLGGTFNFIPVFGFDIYPWGNFAVALYPMVMAFAIFKYELLDIRVTIKKTLTYSIFAFLISVSYLATVFVFYKIFLSKNVPRSSLQFGIFSIFVIAILFKPLEFLLHRLLERRFFRGTIGEIFEQKGKLETELERRERLKSVGILAAGMAHEIKNPLTAIQTFAEYLPQKYGDAEFREKFSRIVIQEVTRIKNIVGDLLLFSKPSEPKKKDFDVNKMLTDLTALLSNEALRFRVKFNYELDAPLVFADPDQVKQALLNLILNALEAMKETGGKLFIRTCASRENAEIRIMDTGPGIPPEKIVHIFDPFFTDKEEGAGLGLAITYSIIEKNSGKISVNSETGKGAEFIIVLPTKFSS